ncbi:class III poly(R)-hydroxyalkanoic acid synthase subunit PhaC [Ruegeria sp. EL01]|jgi:polyhydroxyalkanoate synthase|uniref:class III poly(R)-hydroxyalkanoic acid synthase subunit PhaC n=1 Tax=Ruegeria sp. EL01 TaxID=2107578 RepID=UPI000EA828F2|nr:class III poly(R)-hydroxyalkanoic acid synthase subunit PhaC [Ruegeria sp. EL01]
MVETRTDNVLMNEAQDFIENLSKGAEAFAKIKDADIDVGTAAKTLIHAQDKVTLHHYAPLDGVPATTGPVLICYGLIGRYTMIDLQEDRSLVRNLLARGVDLYVVDWGHPNRSDQCLMLDDYVDWYLEDCVDAICADSGADQVTLLGICEGGVFSTIYAARHPEKIKNLMLTITPIDFHADAVDPEESHGFINLWTRNLRDDDITRLVDAFGTLPGDIMSSVFQQMTPANTMTKYNLGIVDAFKDEAKLKNFLRMEKWLADRPNHPGEAAKQWLIDLYKENRLVDGTLQISGEPVDLAKITMPVLNVYAKGDHIIPPPCSTALGQHVGTKDYSELALPGGHVGVYVSSKSQGIVGDGIFNWLSERQ